MKGKNADDNDISVFGHGDKPGVCTVLLTGHAKDDGLVPAPRDRELR
jgi:hypothetical protein